MLLDLFILILAGSLCTDTMAAHPPPAAPAPARTSTGNYTCTPPWRTLPPTPVLPPSNHEGYAQINNVSLWYGAYGAPLHTTTPTNTNTIKSPIVLLHGGRISSRWYGHLITSLTFSPLQENTVIAIDTRGHGRSTDDLSHPLSYTQFALDAISLLDYLSIPRASFVGWSDGAITALKLAMTHPERVDKVISYGANYRPDQVNTDGLSNLPFGEELVGREIAEYQESNPDPDWELFNRRVSGMQAVEPFWNQDDFAKIPDIGVDAEAPMVLIAAGDHEEAIYHWVPGRIFSMIPNSQLAILPGMSHFGPLQDPKIFAAIVISFLTKPR
ncbi:Alpha/Beta hydrolase protein [Aspergillus filifer]